MISAVNCRPLNRFLLLCFTASPNCYPHPVAQAAQASKLQQNPKYLECCYQHGLSWDAAKQQIQEFLHQRGVRHQGIVRQLALAKPLLQPWLD
jgi:hypothetical protein